MNQPRAQLLLIAGKLVVDEILVCDTAPTMGTNQRARERHVSGGGQVWHTSLAAARAGAQVAITGWCGSDPDSELLRGKLASLSIIDRLAVHDPAPHSTVLVHADDRAIVSYGGGGYLEPAAIPSDALDHVGLLHLDGFTLDDVSGDAHSALAARAHELGIPVTLEPPRTAKITQSAQWIAQLPPLLALLGRPDEIAHTLPILGTAPEITVSHDQHRPVLTCSGADVTSTPVPEVATAPLGAGDRFAGGWLAAVLGGSDLARAATAGISAAQN